MAMQHARAEPECGMTHIEGLSVHKVGSWKGKKLSWESKQDHIRKALKGVSRDWGFRLPRGVTVEREKTLPAPKHFLLSEVYSD